MSPSASPITSTNNASNATTKKTTALGKDDFLKLLTAQLEHQDPLNPMDETQMTGTLAQFSTLEQITNMSSGMGTLANAQKWAQATAYLKHTVTANDGNGTTYAGTVDSVVSVNGNPYLKIKGEIVDPAWVTEIL